MNIKYLVTVACLLTASLGYGQGIEFFSGSWSEVKNKAAQTGKLIMVDAYTTWCGPCKRMASNIFPQKQVGDFYNANFINYKLDMEKGEGPAVGREYKVRAYPTFLFIDGDGNKVFEHIGGSDINGFIKIGSTALSKFDKSAAFATKYEAGDRSPQLYYDYITSLNATNKSSLRFANEYLNNAKDTKSDLHYKIIFESAVTSDSKPFEQLIQNEKTIAKIMSPEAVESKKYKALTNGILKGIEFQDDMLINSELEKSKKTLEKEAYEQFVGEMNFRMADATNDANKALQSARNLAQNLSKGYTADADLVLKVLKTKYGKVEGAVDIAKQLHAAIADNHDDPRKRLEYAMYLSAIKEKSAAQKEAVAAKKAAEKLHIDTTSFDNAILQINAS